MTDSSPKPLLLFTAFEPSGDDHASIIIKQLKAWYPDVRIAAWGGPKMEAAGAEIIERTGDAAVMGMPGLAKIREHKKINERIRQWSLENKVAVHIPVDSPAANFPVCAIMKEQGAKVVHMVAPQLWAWAPWRIRKLRRLTNHVMCVLPFEEKWFSSRGVSATFIGHPLFEKPLDTESLDDQTKDWADGASGRERVAILPGSRPSEYRKNFPLLLGAYCKLRSEHPEMAGMVALTRPEIESELRDIAKEHGLDWPDSLGLTHANTDAVVRWCTLSLVVSGTVTLQIARQHKPMVIVYKIGRIGWSLLARWLIQTPFMTLPNILAGREIVPELVPHFVGSEPIADRATELLEDESKYNHQVRELQRVTGMFSSLNAAVGASEIVARYAGLGLPKIDNPTDSEGSDAQREVRDADDAVPGPIGD